MTPQPDPPPSAGAATEWTGGEPRPGSREAEPQAVQGGAPRFTQAEADELRTFTLERLVFFSDAIFAIAITLLVIDLRLPDTATELSDAGLTKALAELGPRISVYALTFLVIGSYWLAHWRRYQFIVRSDQTLAVINLILLGFVAFMPFPASLLGSYGDHPLAMGIYALTLSAAGGLGTLTFVHAIRAGLIRPGTPPEYLRRGVVRGLSVPIVLLGSFALLPLLGPRGVQMTWLLIPVAQALIVRVSRLPRWLLA